eukprot:TRINITY_DN19519_c0_g1_i4.p1 TRINITY_DN19519_c0_g1~~TRINITY_DN19519_c0_g1_i4.p1  ORF type:complete len:433 (-),score=62.27 TRINITY_DN19519_c0_g1_i4:216-1478(-)
MARRRRSFPGTGPQLDELLSPSHVPKRLDELRSLERAISMSSTPRPPSAEPLLEEPSRNARPASRAKAGRRSSQPSSRNCCRAVTPNEDVNGEGSFESRGQHEGLPCLGSEGINLARPKASCSFNATGRLEVAWPSTPREPMPRASFPSAKTRSLEKTLSIASPDSPKSARRSCSRAGACYEPSSAASQSSSSAVGIDELPHAPRCGRSEPSKAMQLAANAEELQRRLASGQSELCKSDSASTIRSAVSLQDEQAFSTGINEAPRPKHLPPMEHQSQGDQKNVKTSTKEMWARTRSNFLKKLLLASPGSEIPEPKGSGDCGKEELHRRDKLERLQRLHGLMGSVDVHAKPDADAASEDIQEVPKWKSDEDRYWKVMWHMNKQVMMADESNHRIDSKELGVPSCRSWDMEQESATLLYFSR